MTGRHYGKCLLYLQQLGCIRWKDKFTRGWRGLGKHLSQPVWTEWLFYSCYSAFSDRACGENVTPTFQLTKHWDYRSKHHSVDDLTVIGSAALVAPATAGSTNFARTIIAHLLTFGEQPCSVVTLERRYGPRRLRDDDDDFRIHRLNYNLLLLLYMHL